MIREISEVDPRSLLVVLLAFTGNAQVMGLDVTLSAIAPLLVLTQMREPMAIHRSAVPVLLIFIAVLCVAALRAPYIGIPYFDAYWLWPLKAMLLMFLVAFGQDLRWPLGNMIALSLICLALIALGRFENGRLTSVFGPNMLYRVFGFLLIFSVLQSFQSTVKGSRHARRLVLLGCAGLGFFAVLLTGSSGGLIVIVAVFALALWRLSKLLAVAILIPAVLWVMTSGILTGSLTYRANSWAIYSRLVYKSNTLEANDRFLGWREILDNPVTALGYNHYEFGNLWTFGYEYPHNLFIELYGFYGLLGIALILTLILALILSIPRMIQGDILALTFVVLLIGSMLSGDLSDNYGAIGLACALFARVIAVGPGGFAFGHAIRAGWAK